MCGFVGLAGEDPPVAREALPALVRMMATRIRHRGPDDEGVFIEGDARCALGFRRLSILDLSAAGHQPMHSQDGRYVLAFNGEVYGHAVLRRELESRGVAFRGHSDTEVVVEAFARLGVNAVERFDGMFAIALWDRREKRVHLFRDQLGKKPLYYSRVRTTWAFASELSPLELVPGFDTEVSRPALTGLLRYLCVPAPYSIYARTAQVSPGEHIVLDPSHDRPVSRLYWTAGELARERETPFAGTEREAMSAVERALGSAVEKRMVADVPIGAFLSGGIDSSLVVSLMQSLSARPIRTFTIGYEERTYDEATHAAAVARHLGTAHETLRVGPREAIDVIERLGTLFDEPFADASQIPTHLVSVLARRQVTVALSGDGGDELFGGYNRYFLAPALLARAARFPTSVRRALLRAIRLVPAPTLDSLLGGLAPVLPRRLSQLLSGDRIQKAALALDGATDLETLYVALLSNHREPERFVRNASEPRTALHARPTYLRDLGDVERMMLLDTLIYLPNDILTKVDRASMAASLEVRAPFLDLDVASLAWSLPISMKVRDGGKWILKRLLERFVPQALFDRPKIGFGVPIEQWLRSSLRPWAEDLLRRERLESEGFFHADAVRALFEAHLRGTNHQNRLWPILVFQQWLDTLRARGQRPT